MGEGLSSQGSIWSTETIGTFGGRIISGLLHFFFFILNNNDWMNKRGWRLWSMQERKQN